MVLMNMQLAIQLILDTFENLFSPLLCKCVCMRVRVCVFVCVRLRQREWQSSKMARILEL